MKKLIFILPLLYYSCTDDIVADTNEVAPMISLTGIWENSFTYYTNTETGKIDTTVYVYPECPSIFDLDSDSTYTYGYYEYHHDYELDENGVMINVIRYCVETIHYVGSLIFGELDADGNVMEGEPNYIDPHIFKWTADEYQIYWYSQIGEANQDSLLAVVDYSFNGDTLILESQHTRTFQGDIYGDTLYNSKAYFIKVENPLVYLPKP